jgi:HD-GYP domain-containing protein (c-di-GMP phosphodiesterase class II)
MFLDIEKSWPLDTASICRIPEKSHEQFLLEETKKRFSQILGIVFADFSKVLKNENFHKKSPEIESLIFSLLEQNPKSFAALLDRRHDFSTVLHSASVMVLSACLYLHIQESVPVCLHMGNVEDFILAALLHDMGKIHMLDIIRKVGILDASELLRLKKHPEDGVAILEELEINLSMISLNIVKYHHRHSNGTGYPEIAVGEEVDELTYLIGILDSLEAMTSRRRIHNVFPTKDFATAILILSEEVETENKFPTFLFDLVKEALLQQD